MKNVAIIVPTLNKGGAEKVAANLSIEFAKKHNVYLIVFDCRNITYEYSGHLIDLNIVPTNNKIKKIFNIFRRIFATRKIKKKFKIDYSISHLPSANWVNVFSRRNEKVYTYVHNMIKLSFKRKLRERLTARLSDKVICVSESVRNNLINNFNISESKLITIYNFSNKIEVPLNKKNSKIVTLVTMGRLTEAKGQWHLIKAIDYATKKNKNIRLKIYGDGELRCNLEAIIKKRNLQDIVELCGYVQNPFVKLSEGDIYISSSLWEGLPMSLIEAGFCNLPIISTDCDAGCREIIAPDTPLENKTEDVEYAKYGILVPVCVNGDINSTELTEEEKTMGKAILKLAEDDELRFKYSKLSRKRSNDFTPQKIMQNWDNILL